jgi:hypothetical protein
MPLDSLSEPERLRLAQLMKAPLIPPAKPPRTRRQIQWPKWDGWSLSSAKHYLMTNRRLWAAGGATALACLLLLAIAIKLVARRDDEAVKLQVRDAQGQLHIHWDTESALVRGATGAKLFITDGRERLFVSLDNRHLQRGGVSYARRTERVELRMALAEPNGRTIEQTAIFFGAPIPDETPRQLAATAAPLEPTPSISVEVTSPIEPAGTIEHRSRRKPSALSGTNLPFTCATGDVFHKTDAPPGWDNFSCHGKNVWIIAPSQAGADGSGPQRNIDPNNITVQPASAATT